MRAVAVYNVKGGVGKTAVAVNLAAAAARSGRRTLLWDLDEQGSASFILGHDAAPARRSAAGPRHDIRPSGVDGVDLLPADRLGNHLDRHHMGGHLKRLVAGLSADYDVIILDCPPAFGDVARQMLAAADVVVVPVTPSPMSTTAYDALRERLTAERAAPPLLPVFTMVDRRRRLHREVVEAAPDRLAIPYASAVEQMAVRRAPIAPGSEAARAFEALWAAVDAG